MSATAVVVPRLSLDLIDLSSLPPPSAVEALDNPTLFSAWLAKFEELDPSYVTLLESDPVIKLIEVGAYRELIQRQRVNDALLALLLPTSYGSNLDALGARFGVKRLTVEPADPYTVPPTPAIMEEDDPFRIRIGEAPDAWSCAGPLGAYKYYARTADGHVSDVAVYSHPVVNPGSILIVVLTRKDSDASTAVQNVYAYLQKDDVRPLTDNVSVRQANPVPYTISAVLHVGKGPDPALVQQEAMKSLRTYLTGRRKIGKRIPTSGIAGALNLTAVDYVTLGSPAADIVPDNLSYAKPTSISLTIDGPYSPSPTLSTFVS